MGENLRPKTPRALEGGRQREKNWERSIEPGGSVGTSERASCQLG